MSETAGSFAGVNREYMRDEQYGTSRKLRNRADLHRKYTSNPENVYAMMARTTPWAEATQILEVGCGPGWWWQYAQPNLLPGAHVTLTDLSPGMVSEAVGRCEGFGMNVTGLEADVIQLPFPDDSFDLVTAHYMLYHVPDIAAAVAELARVLKSSGTLVAASNGPGHFAQFRGALAEVFTEDGLHAYHINNRFSPESGRAFLEALFAEVSWHPFPDVLNITDLDDAVTYLQTFPPGETATPDQLGRLREALDRQLVDGVLQVSKDTGMFVARSRRRP